MYFRMHNVLTTSQQVDYTTVIVKIKSKKQVFVVVASIRLLFVAAVVDKSQNIYNFFLP